MMTDTINTRELIMNILLETVSYTHLVRKRNGRNDDGGFPKRKTGDDPYQPLEQYDRGDEEKPGKPGGRAGKSAVSWRGVLSEKL